MKNKYYLAFGLTYTLALSLSMIILGFMFGEIKQAFYIILTFGIAIMTASLMLHLISKLFSKGSDGEW